MSDRSPIPHLDDERLSALIDGEATSEETEHAHTCRTCAAALAAWRRTVNAVAEVTPQVEGERRQAAVEAALAAARIEVASGPQPASDGEASPPVEGASGPGPVSDGGASPPVEAASGPGPVSDGGASAPVVPMASRRRRPAWLSPSLAAAAAAVIAITGVAIGVATSGGGGTNQPAAAPALTTNPSVAAPATRSTNPSAAAPAALPTNPAAASAGAAASRAAPTNPAGSSVASSSVGPNLGSYQDPGGLIPALRERLNAANGVGAGPTASTTVAPPVPVATEPSCLNQAASDARAPAGSPPLLATALTYRGSPAQVFVFQVGGRHMAAVVGVPGCRLLTLAAF
jgi:hypothetical protein